MDNKKQTKILYMAYGSNINLSQMAQRCPHSKPLTSMDLKGWELEFRGVANISPNKDSQVPVLFWELDSRDIPSLDRYEGFPKFYYKKDIEFESGGEKCTAMAYLMTPGTRMIEPASEYYLQTIWKGYLENGMDTSCLLEAQARALDIAAQRELEMKHNICELDEQAEDTEQASDMEDDIQMSFSG